MLKMKNVDILITVLVDDEFLNENKDILDTQCKNLKHLLGN